MHSHMPTTNFSHVSRTLYTVLSLAGNAQQIDQALLLSNILILLDLCPSVCSLCCILLLFSKFSLKTNNYR